MPGAEAAAPDQACFRASGLGVSPSTRSDTTAESASSRHSLAIWDKVARSWGEVVRLAIRSHSPAIRKQRSLSLMLDTSPGSRPEPNAERSRWFHHAMIQFFGAERLFSASFARATGTATVPGRFKRSKRVAL